MIKFEYRIIDFNAFSNEAPDFLNNMGNNGWELVGFSNPIPYSIGEGFFIRYIFKKKKGQRGIRAL